MGQVDHALDVPNGYDRSILGWHGTGGDLVVLDRETNTSAETLPPGQVSIVGRDGQTKQILAEAIDFTVVDVSPDGTSLLGIAPGHTVRLWHPSEIGSGSGTDIVIDDDVVAVGSLW